MWDVIGRPLPREFPPLRKIKKEFPPDSVKVGGNSRPPGRACALGGLAAAGRDLQLRITCPARWAGRASDSCSSKPAAPLPIRARRPQTLPPWRLNICAPPPTGPGSTLTFVTCRMAVGEVRASMWFRGMAATIMMCARLGPSRPGGHGAAVAKRLAFLSIPRPRVQAAWGRPALQGDSSSP